MSDQNAELSGGEIGRWLLLLLLLVACLGAYFALASRVPPVVVPYSDSDHP